MRESIVTENLLRQNQIVKSLLSISIQVRDLSEYLYRGHFFSLLLVLHTTVRVCVLWLD